MLTSNIQLGYVLTRSGWQAIQGGLSCHPPRISERMDNPQILLHHLLQEYLVERDINFTAMFTSNIQLGCTLTRDGGQAVQHGLSCPSPRISERKDNQQILLHHLLEEYLVESDINFISVYLISLLQMFSWVTYWQGVGGKLSRANSNIQLGCILTRGGGQAVQGSLSCPPPRISNRKNNPQILLHHLLQKYLVSRDINFISVNLKCLNPMFTWVTYRHGVGGKLLRAVYLAPRPEFHREQIIRKFYYTIYYRHNKLKGT